jgi:hypothetical protein
MTASQLAYWILDTRILEKRRKHRFFFTPYAAPFASVKCHFFKMPKLLLVGFREHAYNTVSAPVSSDTIPLQLISDKFAGYFDGRLPARIPETNPARRPS